MTLSLETPLRRMPDYPSQSLPERALDILFPPTCVGCRKIGRWVCERCWVRMAWIEEDACSVCGRAWVASPCPYCRRQPCWLDSVSAVCSFEDTAREAVHALKYHGRHAISGVMGRLMAEVAQAEGITVVVPAPLHASRRRQRGYDQAAMLARHVAKGLDLPFDDGMLKRVRRTKDQIGLDAKQRAENLRNAFKADIRAEGEAVLLVDDVFTTGTTMDSAARSLHDAGAAMVSGVVFAAAPLGGNDAKA